MKSNIAANNILIKFSGAIIWRMERLVDRLKNTLFALKFKSIGFDTDNKIKTFTTNRELQTLYALASMCKVNSRGLEIGSYLGASTCYIAAAFSKSNSNLICVDTWQNETMPDGIHDTYTEFLTNTKAVHSFITTVRKRSDDIKVDDIMGSLNFVFIDGDHSYEAVKKDFNIVSKLVEVDAIIAFHDCLACPGVARVIGEAVASGEWFIAGQVDNLCWIKSWKSMAT